MWQLDDGRYVCYDTCIDIPQNEGDFSLVVATKCVKLMKHEYDGARYLILEATKTTNTKVKGKHDKIIRMVDWNAKDKHQRPDNNHNTRYDQG